MKKGNPVAFIERIQKYPELHHRFEQLLTLVEDNAGDVQKASEAEQRVIEELQQMGKVALTAWGNQKIANLSTIYDKKTDSRVLVKKTLVAYELRKSQISRTCFS